MTLSVIDPLQGDFPEVIEEYLEHGIMKCIAFNRRGTLLAAGCSDGGCIIWDFETRVIAKELRDEGCNKAITSVSWSKYGHRILVSAADKSLTLWDVSSGEQIARTTLTQTAMHARLHPGSSHSSLCLTCGLSSPPTIVDLSTGDKTELPMSASDTLPEASFSRAKLPDSSTPFCPPAACFNKYGDLVYVGNSKGEILIINYQPVKVCGLVSVPGGAVVKNITFSRSGEYLLTNSNDRIIRIFSNLLPSRDSLTAIDELDAATCDLVGSEKLRAVGSKCLAMFREFQDSVTRLHWRIPCFSGDGEWVIGGAASKGEHKIYIWDRAGHLVKILEGPKEALIDLAWHPVNPIVASVSLTGLVYIWAKDYTENWSAFAPDFKELEENEEYVEREDEFDIVPESEKVKETDGEDEVVDIVTVERDSVLTDSDSSCEELCFLPPIPCPDDPQLLDYPDDPFSVNLVESNQSVTPDAEDDDDGSSLKRRQKPSEKGLEQQSDMVVDKIKKPFKKLKPSSKVVKDKSDISDEYDNFIWQS